MVEASRGRGAWQGAPWGRARAVCPRLAHSRGEACRPKQARHRHREEVLLLGRGTPLEPRLAGDQVP